MNWDRFCRNARNWQLYSITGKNEKEKESDQGEGVCIAGAPSTDGPCLTTIAPFMSGW